MTPTEAKEFFEQCSGSLGESDKGKTLLTALVALATEVERLSAIVDAMSDDGK